MNEKSAKQLEKELVGKRVGGWTIERPEELKASPPLDSPCLPQGLTGGVAKYTNDLYPQLWRTSTTATKQRAAPVAYGFI